MGILLYIGMTYYCLYMHIQCQMHIYRHTHIYTYICMCMCKYEKNVDFKKILAYTILYVLCKKYFPVFYLVIMFGHPQDWCYEYWCITNLYLKNTNLVMWQFCFHCWDWLLREVAEFFSTFRSESQWSIEPCNWKDFVAEDYIKEIPIPFKSYDSKNTVWKTKIKILIILKNDPKCPVITLI